MADVDGTINLTAIGEAIARKLDASNSVPRPFQAPQR